MFKAECVGKKAKSVALRLLKLAFVIWCAVSLRKLDSNHYIQRAVVNSLGVFHEKSNDKALPVTTNSVNTTKQSIQVVSLLGKEIVHYMSEKFQYSLERDGKTRRLPDRFMPGAKIYSKTFEISIRVPKSGQCEDIRLLILVKSSLYHFQERDAIRRTWASYSNVEGTKLRTVFLLGMFPNQSDANQVALDKERNDFDDMIFGDFVDTYRNLTLKALMGLKYVFNYCRSAEFILCVDDDVFAKVPSIIRRHLSSLSRPATNVMQCGLQTARFAKVTRRGKWAVPKEAYDRIYYPPYCLGPCYLLSTDVAVALYEASQTVPTDVPIDDAYVTGILRENVGLDLSFMRRGLCRHFPSLHNVTEKLFDAWKEKVDV